jgi:cyclin-dependent kinase regulatory subunit CKS1
MSLKYTEFRMRCPIDSKLYAYSYSELYSDAKYEYRHIILPKDVIQHLPNQKDLLTPKQWAQLGVNQSPGWVNYMTHSQSPAVLLFRRPIRKPTQKN